MSFSSFFINRPVATTLSTAGITLAGIAAFFLLPVAPLPQVDMPTIMVQASLPGASPETMATSVATPLEHHLGHIADVTEMTSQSTVGNARITLQFGYSRDIDGAARDVQAAINAARADLPAALKSNPTYRKINPADAPVMVLALTSQTLQPGQIYDVASTILAQKISQIQGVGQVTLGGSSLPAVRVDINPLSLAKYSMGLEDVRAALASANANSPKGALEETDQYFQVYTNDQAQHASDYQSLVIAYRNNAPVRLEDIANVTDSVEDIRNQGIYNGEPSVVMIITKQPGANIIETVDRVKKLLPQLQASIPGAISLTIALDRTRTIRASLRDIERSLSIAIGLVILVVFLFLRNGRATLIPAIAVPVSLTGTFGIMYLLNYSLDNLSLMALTIATGFVVDDAIVVLENITRHIEAGMPRLQATLQGTREVAFTVISMSISLIAIFIPILLMNGIIGRLFREFAVTLSVAVAISLLVSLTTTPMMCALLLNPTPHKSQAPPKKTWLSGFYRHCEKFLILCESTYNKLLIWSFDHSLIIAAILLITIGLNIFLYIIVPKGLLPQQDTGQLIGNVIADQSISFQSMRQKMTQFAKIAKADPNVEGVAAFTGGNGTNSAFVFVTLKNTGIRQLSAEQVIAQLRPRLSHIPGATLFLQAAQDIRVGGRSSNAQFQYSLQGDDLNQLHTWTSKLTDALKKSPELTDVNSDQRDYGLETNIIIDRDTASRLGLNASQIDNTLYDAFGQRQVSIIYNALNQYHVVMEVAPQFWQSPETLNDLYISTSGGAASGTQTTSATLTGEAANLNTNGIAATGKGGASTGTALSIIAETMVPLSAFSRFVSGTSPLSINHQGHFAATTISFNLLPGKSLGDATGVIERISRDIGIPSTIHGEFQGIAQVFQKSLANEPLLILAALLTIYIVLGILYESYIHPVTILSTLPSAGVGAVLALLIFKVEFSLISMIGVILLIGIVKKNAILLIDFALDAERTQNLSSREAIHLACLMRFRPIMMTTMAALFGALPLAIGFGEGSELRRPLGISIIGGLIISQMLTLFTTPIIYLFFDRFRLWCHSPRLKNRSVV